MHKMGSEDAVVSILELLFFLFWVILSLHKIEHGRRIWWLSLVFSLLVFRLINFVHSFLKIIGKDLFKVLKRTRGANFNSFISEKTTLVPGDITCEDLGLEDPNLVEEMMRELDVVVNLAATTNFDER